ncbi:MAG: Gfo/Idh/MocA family oxidoreductase [Clostridiales bacterium]|jgi:predicted dehydrogenase|nr:Gfo/Idh/MocA family oxidoreductase [Clostridiales bacterium]
MKKLRVGVIGAGFIGKQHVEAIRRIPGAEVAAIADSNPAIAESAGESLCIDKYYDDYKKMLDFENLDIVHNCTPSGMHYPVNLDVLNRKIPLYCEKPLTLTAQESQKLCEIADMAGVKTAVNFNYRNNVMVHEMRERVKSGIIGKVLAAHGEYLQDWLLFNTDYDWRMDPSVGGESRAVADIGSHCFDTAQYVLGKKIKSVYAKLITVHPHRYKNVNKEGTFGAAIMGGGEKFSVSSEDAAYIMAEFEDNTPCLFNISQVCAGKKNGLMLNTSGSISSLEWRQETADRLYIGRRDNGNDQIYASAQYLTDYAKKYATLPSGHAVGWADAFRNGIAAFYEDVRTGVPSGKDKYYADFSDGLYVMKIVEACLKSNRLNKWVDVEE